MATRTSDLTEKAKSIADDMALRCGTLKVALSAGIIALSRLSAEDREKCIAEANGSIREYYSPSNDEDMLKKMIETEQSAPGTIIKILSREDSTLLNAFRKAVSPPQKEKRKRG